MFWKFRMWWQLRRLERDRAFLLTVGHDSRSQELLPLVEAEINRLRALHRPLGARLFPATWLALVPFKPERIALSAIGGHRRIALAAVRHSACP